MTWHQKSKKLIGACSAAFLSTFDGEEGREKRGRTEDSDRDGFSEATRDRVRSHVHPQPIPSYAARFMTDVFCAVVR